MKFFREGNLKIENMKEIIQLKNIKKSFDETEVLNNFNLSINKGEFITLLGASGCGKTTILRLIAGLEKVDEGQIFINGNDVTNLEANKRQVNMVFQSYALFPFMNVADNVGYSLKIRKVKKEEIKVAVEKALELVQLEGFEKRMPGQLSGGQKQRVAIARAIVNKSEILLLDEPLSALDASLRQQMQVELKQLQRELGITFIYITHDQEEALNMSDRIVVMNQGKIEQIGTPDEIYYQPKTVFVAEFVGKANILTDENGDTIAVRSENVNLSLEGGEDCLPGTVISKSFVMGIEKVVVKLDNGTTIEARNPEFSSIKPDMKIFACWEKKNAIKVLRRAEDEGK